MIETTLQHERQHLAVLLEAIQRCVYFLDASVQKIAWPLTSEYLEKYSKDVQLFESLSSVNERFSKLQDTLGGAMRHAALLAGEPTETFLKVLSFYEKTDVIDSIESWQSCRALRNAAAHDYGIDYAEIAEHFNALREFIPFLCKASGRLLQYCDQSFGITPIRDEFSDHFSGITRENQENA